jgi:diguanylate cyclase (GGDEF)-like protein
MSITTMVGRTRQQCSIGYKSGRAIIRKYALISVIGLLTVGASLAASTPQSVSDRIETLDWSDPELALRAIETLGPSNEGLETDIPMLEIQGVVYADMHRQSKVDETIARLHALGAHGNGAATLAEHFVRAYSLFERGKYTAASAELSTSNIGEIKLLTERYRFLMLQGSSLRQQQQSEAALPILEQTYALAQQLGDDVRALHAMLAVTRLNITSRHLSVASTQLETARNLATSLGDESALADVDGCASLIADLQGDRTAERRTSLSAFEHAKLSGSGKWITRALVDLSDSYLKTRDFGQSLKYSEQALSIASTGPHTQAHDFAQFNGGLAYIGLGRLKAGRERVEHAIDDTLASDNLPVAESLLREYADALEQAGYLVMAIDVYRRHDELGEKVISRTRQLAFELSARSDSERRARDAELSRRDDDLKAAQMQEQRLRQQLALAAAVFIACICAALLWAFIRVRKANEHLRLNNELDPLTGLRNRRFFNEHILPADGGRPVVGCVLLVDIDHFKRVNDTFGHPAGDAVLTALSQRLAATLRADDNLVRWGGEEFLAVLDSISPEQADLTVARLLGAVRQDPIVCDGQSIHCTISIGYACFPMTGSIGGIRLETAIRLVDKALYEAKRRGRDRACRVGALGVGKVPNLSVVGNRPDATDADFPIHFVEMVVAA